MLTNVPLLMNEHVRYLLHTLITYVTSPGASVKYTIQLPQKLLPISLKLTCPYSANSPETIKKWCKRKTISIITNLKKNRRNDKTKPET